MDNIQKLLRFRYFFCGRDDVYAWRIPSGKRQGQYLPRRVPQYLLDDQTLMRHIRGYDLLGAYPMLKHNNTHWVAADFDGKNDNAFEEAWKLKELLEYLGVRTLCNTSQSGKGVHVRVVFKKSVPAWLARNLMTACIEKENILTLKEGGAFDRLFPAQDALTPHDPMAIGNQLGMPLNMRAAEERGGCVLLDSNFDKVEFGPAIWDYLDPYRELPERLQITDALMDLGRHTLLLEPQERKMLETMTLEEAWSPANAPPKRHREKRDFAPMTNDDLYVVVYGCEYMKYANKNWLGYNLWWPLASMLCRFDGVGGRRMFHVVSYLDPRYDFDKTEKKYDQVLAGVKAPVKCSTVAKYGFECPMLGVDGMCDKFRNQWGRGPKTPATIPYFFSINTNKQAQGEGASQ